MSGTALPDGVVAGSSDGLTISIGAGTGSGGVRVGGVGPLALASGVGEPGPELPGAGEDGARLEGVGLSGVTLAGVTLGIGLGGIGLGAAAVARACGLGR
jgi:hypothetical protein